MKRSSHFLYRNKIIILNFLFGGFIIGLNPEYLNLIPDTQEMNYYMGVVIIAALFFEFSSIYYKSRFIFSFHSTLHRKIPWFIGTTFVIRVLISGFFAMLALYAMDALKVSDFFLLPIILYSALKEFWVRRKLLNTDREKNERLSGSKVWLGEIFFFVFMCIMYASIWKYYLLEHPSIMYLIMSPINWGFVAIAMFLIIYCIEMPYFLEEYLKNKKRSEKIISFISIILPVIALIGQFYLISYVY